MAAATCARATIITLSDDPADFFLYDQSATAVPNDGHIHFDGNSFVSTISGGASSFPLGVSLVFDVEYGSGVPMVVSGVTTATDYIRFTHFVADVGPETLGISPGTVAGFDGATFAIPGVFPAHTAVGVVLDGFMTDTSGDGTVSASLFGGVTLDNGGLASASVEWPAQPTVPGPLGTALFFSASSSGGSNADSTSLGAVLSFQGLSQNDRLTLPHSFTVMALSDINGFNPVSEVPEPASLAMLTGLTVLMLRRRSAGRGRQA